MNFSKRRTFLKAAAASASMVGVSMLPGCASVGSPRARVAIVGGGYGGATAARYLKLWEPSIDVTLIERETRFVSCPISNLVLANYAQIDDITLGYEGLRRAGITIIHDEAVAVDAAARRVRLRRGSDVAYDRLIVTPGIDFSFEEIENYQSAMASGHVLHAWKAGPQTLALRRQIEQMRDGGVVALSIPLAPYRCPPGPYERACMVAALLKRTKPRSKLLVLDANPDITSKGGLFKAAWKDLYAGIIDYRPNARAIGIDASSMTLKLEVEDVKADVLNVIPAQRAADIARGTGLITHNDRWCDVDWRTMESKKVPGIHILGDATLSAPVMPKSASMASSHAKIAAAAIIELLAGRSPSQDTQILNTCYSFVSQTEAIRVSSVHRWNAEAGTLSPVAGSGGVSSARSEAEGTFAWNWARSIWSDSFA
jgi:sulfide dehydrogenase [flavocytochrome c] flavoprotein subunit